LWCVVRRAGLFAVAVAIAVRCSPPAPPLAPRGAPGNEAWLDADEVARADIGVTVAEEHVISNVMVTPGRVAFDENRVAHVFSPVNGQVRAIDGELGAHVARGHTLAVIASPDLGQATADLGKALADLVATQHAKTRQSTLWQARATTLADVQQAMDDWRTAQAEEQRAVQKVVLLHAGGAVSQSFEVKSPLDGKILARGVTPGLQIQGIWNGGTAPELFTVGDLEEVWVFSAVHEADFARVQVGAHAEVSVRGVTTPYEGYVDWVSGALDPQTRTATLRCVVRNRGEELRPEMLIVVAVDARPERALAIPRPSIEHMGGASLVFFDRGLSPDARERFERLPIIANEYGSGYFVPVTQGVELGDRVVTRGMAALSAKMRR
jgi:cobalt-zinc-cadmium efflux system membrane fusion protein